MSDRYSFTRSKLITSIVFYAIALKLAISPWASGVYSSSVGKLVNYSCDGVLLIIALSGYLAFPQRYTWLYISFLVSGFTYFLSTFFYTEQNALAFFSAHLKMYLPLLIFPILLKSFVNEKRWFLFMVKSMALWVITLLFVGLLFLPDTLNRLTYWWPSYFGKLHTTSYAALMIVFITYGLYLHQQVRLALVIFVTLTVSAAIFSGWGVRTATLSSLIFIILLVSNNYRIARRRLWNFGIILMPLGIVSFAVFIDFDSAFDNLTSGRLSMYVAKFHQLIANDFFQWFIGNGFGSDMIDTAHWYGTKGAHSDFITVVVEGGLTYLILFVLVLVTISRNESLEFKYLLVSVSLTSIISNGIFVRPVAGYLLAIALVLFTSSKRLGKPKSSMKYST